MATSRKQPPKRPQQKSLLQMPSDSSSVGVMDAPEPPETVPEFDSPPPTAAAPAQPPPSEPKKMGRPKNTDPPRATDFFERVKAVETADWGTRVYLYLYQLEPVCDLKQQGGKAYLMRYQAPVQDEHQIMLEQGSGVYRFVLAYNKITPTASNEICRYEFTIYNPKYPPKIPREVWINDPRNKRWEALLPKEPPPGPAPLDPLAAFGTFMDIQDRVQERMTPPTQPPPPPAPTTDPWEAAERIMNMRSENPMVDILRDELKEMRHEMRDSRDKAALREEKLQDELRKAQAPTGAPKSMADQLLEIAALGEKLEPFKKMFGFGNGNGANGDGQTRAARTTGLDIARDIALKVFDGPVGEGIGALLTSMASRNAQGPVVHTMNGNPPVNQAQQTPQAELWQFVETVLNPALLAQYPQGFSGASFAEWLYDGYPDRLLQFQQFTHPKLPGLRGAAAIIAGYKNSPAMWPILKLRGEEAFVQFVQEFCAWRPEGSDEPEDVEESGVIDLDDAQEARVS